MKTFLFILKILRWILGSACFLISLGLFVDESFEASIVVVVLAIFLLPLTGDFIISKVMQINFDGTGTILKTINYSDLHTILPTYEQNVLNHKKSLTDKQRIRLGRKIYYNTLRASVSDFNITQNEIFKLNEIKTYFSLSDQQILFEKNRISEKTVKSLIQKSYDNQVLTDSENQQIINIATFLQFSLARTEALKSKTAFLLFNRILEEKTSDKRLSPREETELKQATRNLKINHLNIKTFISERKIKSLYRAKLLWNLDHGIFETIYNPPITLNRDEQCYMNVNAELIVNKLVHAGYSRTSTGLSFRVMKGVNARIGGGRYRPIKENVTEVHSGTLFLTNSRVVFNAGGKSFQIPFSKLISHHIRGEDLEFTVQNKNYSMSLSRKDAEVFSIGLSSSLRQYGNSNDHLKIQAMRERSMNETFI